MGERIIKNRNINESDNSIQCNNCGNTWFVQNQAARYKDQLTFTPNQKKAPQEGSQLTVLQCIHCGTVMIPPTNATGTRAIDNYMIIFNNEIKDYIKLHDRITTEEIVQLKKNIEIDILSTVESTIIDKINAIFDEYIKQYDNIEQEVKKTTTKRSRKKNPNAEIIE